MLAASQNTPVIQNEVIPATIMTVVGSSDGT